MTEPIDGVIPREEPPAPAEPKATGPSKASGDGLDLIETRVGEMLTKKHGIGFDPAMIIMMVQAIITALSNCKKPTPATLKQPNAYARATLGTAIRQQTGYRYRDALEHADLIFGLTSEASDADLNLVIRDCCG